MAIFGWTTKNQTTTYTKKARRKQLAAEKPFGLTQFRRDDDGRCL
ncbi:hypothetical protein AB4Z34_29450 [Ensifer sp. 2YAB10]